MSETAFLPRVPAASDDARTDIRAGIIVLAAFFIGFLGWAAFTPLDAAVVAPGVVVVSGNRQTVQHREGGVVSKLLVRDGQQVERGQVLIELAAGEAAAREQALTAQVIELEARRARLVAEAAGADKIERPASWEGMPEDHVALADATLARHQAELDARDTSMSAQVDVLRQRQRQLQARIAGYEQQITASQRQEALLEEELTGMRTLAEKNLIPLPRVRALERAQADLMGQRGEYQAQIEQSRAAIGETRLQILSLRSDRREDEAAELRDVDTRLADARPQLAAAREQLERTRLRAPAAGTVVGLAVFTEGGVIRPGERVLDIVPQDQPLVVEAKVRPEDADDIFPGLTTEVRITAFHGRALPLVHGEVKLISADRILDERTGESYFRTEVEVSQQELDAALDSIEGARRGLSAGLPAEVIVPTRQRTALDYLIEPLTASLRRSFREQ